LFIGPAGCGKSSLGTRFLVSAAERGERGVLFAFDELPESILTRCKGLGIPLESHIKKGLISIQQLDPAQVSPGEFVARIRAEVERNNCRILLIDSINGLFNAMQQEQSVIIHLHELLSYLNQSGVLSIMILAQYGLVGSHMQSPLDVSYLADNVLLFRYFEARGAIRQAISVVKRRSGPHERTIRELVIAENRISVGEPLAEFEGVLSGAPRYVGGPKDLSQDE
jgi:circadian clock protein KaiC